LFSLLSIVLPHRDKHTSGDLFPGEETIPVRKFFNPVASISFLLILLITFPGCSLRTRMMVDVTTPVVKAMNIALNKNCDIDLMRDSMPFGLYSISGLIDISPKNKEFLTNGAHGYFGYAFAFVEDENPERAKRIYIKARDYGLRAIYKNKYHEILNAPANDFSSHIQKIRKRDITPLFWTTLSWLSYIRLNLSDVKVFLELPKAEALANKLMELDENYFFASPHVIMACYYAAQPEITGGNPAKAKEHFEKAIKLSDEKFLMHYLYYAKFYAVRVQDRQLYIKLLKHVMNAPEDILDGYCSLTNICKAKAKIMLENVDDFF